MTTTQLRRSLRELRVTQDDLASAVGWQRWQVNAVLKQTFIDQEQAKIFLDAARGVAQDRIRSKGR